MAVEHELKVLSVDTALELMGSPELFVEIAGMLLDELPELMSLIHKYAASGDLVELSKTAHRVKGNFGIIAAEQAAAAARDLEHTSRDGDRVGAEAAIVALDAAAEYVVPELQRLIAKHPD